MTSLDVDLEMLERPMPASLGMEENVVGAAMLAPRVLDELATIGVTVGDFYHPAIAAIWRAVRWSTSVRPSG